MRRKSTRNASKTTPEKPAVEVPQRRSRRHSKRRKRSSSTSSSNDSDDVSLKTIAQQQAAETSQEVKVVSLEKEDSSEQPVWKVTPSSTPTGEIQKLKICLTRPLPMSPEKTERSSRRRRHKSGSNIDEEVEEKVIRKSARHLGSPGPSVEEEEFDEPEDKRGKGKSKAKHKSKSEKAPQTQDVEDQSEISENVQVTPQSPQATIDIPVDNENVPSNEHETISSGSNETHSVPQIINTTRIVDVKHGSPKAVSEEKDDSLKSDNNKVDADVSELQTDLQLPNDASQETDTTEQIEKVMDDSQTVTEMQMETTETQQEEKIDTPNHSLEMETEANDDSKKPEEQISEVPIEEINERHVETSEAGAEVNKEQTETNEEQSTTAVVESHENKEDSPAPMEIEESKIEAPQDESETTTHQNENETTTHQNENETTTPQNDSETGEALPEISKEEAVSFEDKVQIEQTEESRSESPSSEGAAIPHQSQEEQENEHSPLLPPPNQKDTSIDESSMKSPTLEGSRQSDEDSRSIDAATMDTNSTPQKEDTSFSLTQSFSSNIREITEVNEELQTMKQQMQDMFKTPELKERTKYKWTHSLLSLEPHITAITIDMIKEFCPDLQFLNEDEVKIDIHETRDRRKSSSEYRERRTDRKVSVEYKSEGGDHRQFETQISLNSMEVEETNDPEKDNSNIIAMNRKISIVDDTASKLKPPPSPAKHPVSEVLHITNLVRPFTLKALKELLERTGKIKENGFWTNRIKSQCYVYYETAEEAEVTRNALHGVHWPIGNGKKLMIDFATPEALEEARKPPPVVPEPRTDTENQENPQVPALKRIEDPEKMIMEKEKHRPEVHVREWDIGKEDLHRGRSRSRDRMRHAERNDRHRHKRTPSPVSDFISRKQRKREEDIPPKLMDDLFRKTKATPSIYWLPLTPEEIATKQQQRLLRMAEHKRRMEESSRARGDYGRGAPFRRRYD